MRKLHLFLAFIFSTPLAYAGGGFNAVSFPQSSSDLSFADRVAIQTAGYEPYSGLSAYEYFNLVEAETDMQEEIEEDEKTEDDQESEEDDEDEDENKKTNAGTNKSKKYIGAIVSPGYCKTRSSRIPFGQKIPLGNPTDASINNGVCSKYGWRKMGKDDDPHYGIDLGCNKKWLGTPVYAIADGKVIRIKGAGNNEAAGNYIKIRHASGFVSYYMHLDKIMVSNGQTVQAGCQIGTLGHTGGAKAAKVRTLSANQSHLHYQLGYNGNQHSITAPNGKTLELRGLNGKALSYSINPTEFLCYDGTDRGACGWNHKTSDTPITQFPK